jgi:hypothetical protein
MITNTDQPNNQLPELPRQHYFFTIGNRPTLAQGSCAYTSVQAYKSPSVTIERVCNACYT